MTSVIYIYQNKAVTKERLINVKIISRLLFKLYLVGIKIVKVVHAAVHLLCSRIPHGKREDEKTLK